MCSVEYWFEDAQGILQRRPRAVKVLPYSTPCQVALADREAANLAALSPQGQPCPFAPSLFHKVIAPASCGAQQAWLYMRYVESPII